MNRRTPGWIQLTIQLSCLENPGHRRILPQDWFGHHEAIEQQTSEEVPKTPSGCGEFVGGHHGTFDYRAGKLGVLSLRDLVVQIDL